MSGSINISDLTDEIGDVLLSYSKNITETLNEEGEKSIKELVKRTKKDAPENKNSKGKHYKRQIGYSVEQGSTANKTYIMHVKGPKYRLAHLLNDGHLTRNGKRVPGDEHITKNAETVLAQYEESVKEAIERAGY